jgi:hypothetical protein
LWRALLSMPADAWLSLQGGLASSYLALHLRRDPYPSPLRRKALWLLGVLSALLWLRALAWTVNEPTLSTLAHLPAVALPLASALFVEALLRRHLPLALKLLLAAGSLAFLWADLSGLRLRSIAVDNAFSAYALLVLAWLMLELWMARAMLGAAEKRNSLGLLAAMAFIAPLEVSDLLPPGYFPLRAGGLGAVILAWVLVRQWAQLQEPASLLRGLAGAVLQGLLGGLATAALAQRGDAQFLLPATAVATGFVLLYNGLTQLRLSSLESEQAGFLRWLDQARLRPDEALRVSLAQSPLLQEHLLLQPAHLEGFDPAVLGQSFDAGRATLSLVELQAALAKAPSPNAEQWLALLRTHGYDHVLQLQRQPGRYLLFQLPRLDGAVNHLLQLKLLRKLYELETPA